MDQACLIQKINILASLGSWAGLIESNQVGNPKMGFLATTLKSETIANDDKGFIKPV